MPNLTSASTQAAIAGSGSWFQSLPQALREWLIDHAEVRGYASGKRLFARGDPPDGIYCVTRGSVRVTGITAAGSEALLAMLEAPNWFGEIALFDDEPRTHDAWAQSDVTVLRVPQDLLLRRLRETPQEWRHLGRLLTQKFRVVFISLEELALLSPTVRLARRLITMAAGYGALADHSKRVLQVSQEQLALMLSMSRQTVNQSLRELESTGAIRRSRGSIEILDLSKLSAVQA